MPRAAHAARLWWTRFAVPVGAGAQMRSRQASRPGRTLTNWCSPGCLAAGAPGRVGAGVPAGPHWESTSACRALRADSCSASPEEEEEEEEEKEEEEEAVAA